VKRNFLLPSYASLRVKAGEECRRLKLAWLAALGVVTELQSTEIEWG